MTEATPLRHCSCPRFLGSPSPDSDRCPYPSASPWGMSVADRGHPCIPQLMFLATSKSPMIPASGLSLCVPDRTGPRLKVWAGVCVCVSEWTINSIGWSEVAAVPSDSKENQRPGGAAP